MLFFFKVLVFIVCFFLTNDCLFYEITPKFEDYEQAWETDSEEEAFAVSLAEKPLESAAGASQADLDDEDPDTADWSDYETGDTESGDDENDLVGEDENEMAASDDSDSSTGAEGFVEETAGDAISDEDDFMDALSSDSDSNSDGSEDDFDLPTFADADEYEKLGHQNWTKLKRSSKEIQNAEEKSDHTSKRKTKKRKKSI